MPGRLKTLIGMVPNRLPPPSPVDRPQVFAARGTRRKRVALLSGCVQQTLAPQINEATVRLLTRHGCEVIVADGAGCCGALEHHLGHDALDRAKGNIDAWLRVAESGGLDAIVVNASGCGTMLKDYGFLLRGDAAYAEKARRVASLTMDVTELMEKLGLRQPINSTGPTGHRVAYQSPCSMQHGQQIMDLPKALLSQAGFVVADVPEGHLCCGSAGTYSILQPELAARLGDRKADHIASVDPDMVASGNIGCMTQLAPRLGVPIVHTVELLDWATGGEIPGAMRRDR